MKHVATCLPLIVKRSQQILRLVSHDAATRHVRQDIQRTIVDLPVGSKGFVQIDESPVTEHAESNVIPNVFPKDRFVVVLFVGHIQYVGDGGIVKTHDEIWTQFQVVMLIPRVRKPFHFQRQFFVEFDDGSSVLGGSMHVTVVDDHLVSLHFDIKVILFPRTGSHFVTFTRIQVFHLIVSVRKKGHHGRTRRHVAHRLHFSDIDFQGSFGVPSSVAWHQFIHIKTPLDQGFVSLVG